MNSLRRIVGSLHGSIVAADADVGQTKSRGRPFVQVRILDGSRHTESMQPSTPATMEIRDLPAAIADAPTELPDVPGGWTERAWQIAGREFRLLLPAAPDALLDDPDVHARHEQDEYMPYWAYLWPASLPMAAAVLRAGWLAGTPVLELGAGIGLVGLAGLSAGLRVVFSDYDAASVQLALINARRAGFPAAEGLVLDWRQPPPQTFPVLLGCELLYEDRNHEPLLQLTRQMLAPGGVAWFGDGGRVRAQRFCRLLPEYGLSFRLLDEDGRPLSDFRVGRYQLIEVRRAAAAGPPSTPVAGV